MEETNSVDIHSLSAVSESITSHPTMTALNLYDNILSLQLSKDQPSSCSQDDEVEIVSCIPQKLNNSPHEFAPPSLGVALRNEIANEATGSIQSQRKVHLHDEGFTDKDIEELENLFVMDEFGNILST